MPSHANGVGIETPVPGPNWATSGGNIARFDRVASDSAGTTLCRRASEPVRSAVERGIFAGAVTGIASPDGRTEIEACGLADREVGRAMTPDSIFWIASLTKSVTSTLVMMLVDEGKLDLDAPVERYLPEFRDQTVTSWFGWGARPCRRATVADLMRHVSGMPAYLPSDARPLDRTTLAEKSRRCGAIRLESQPGEKHLYSNLNYEVLGRLIEVASGGSYEAFLQSRLLEPLGMNETTFHPSASQLSRLALPYGTAGDPGSLERRPFMLVSEPFDDPRREPTPAFGLFSTAENCLRFCRLHLQGGEWEGRRLLSAESALLLMKRFDGPLGAEHQGLAWCLAPGAACMSGAMGTWMTLHLRLGIVSVFLTSCAEFGDNGTVAACSAFSTSVGQELRFERTTERDRVLAERRLAHDAWRNAIRERRRYRDAIQG